MKSPKTADAKFNAVYKELKIAIGDTHTDLEILDMTRALLDIQKEDFARDKTITRDHLRVSELDFSNSNLSSVDYVGSFDDLPVLDSNEIDGMYVPDSYILKTGCVSSYGLGA